ncbi:MAG: DNA polymerase ligase N-terminal domain-containing protein [Candidatus Calescibacterium sp.]
MKLPYEMTEGEFVIHQHKAKRLHWDLRLEVPSTPDDFEQMDKKSYELLGIKVENKDTVMWSFAIPKAKEPAKGEKLLAIETEPHPVEYNNFEGKIPEGMYGAGDVKIYDRGKVKWISVKNNRVVFELEGEKIKGKFILFFFKEEGGQRKWLWSRVEQDS